MENVVLGLLMLENFTIYGLNQAFKRGISMFYSASYGSLQAAVKNLLDKGSITFEEKVDHGRNKKVYSITEPGIQAFYQWMLEEVPPSKLEVTALSKVFFLGLIQSREQRKQIVLEILKKIEQVENQLTGLDGEYSKLQIPDSYRDIFKYQMKTLDYGLHAHLFAKEWFHALLDDIEDER